MQERIDEIIGDYEKILKLLLISSKDLKSQINLLKNKNLLLEDIETIAQKIDELKDEK